MSFKEAGQRINNFLDKRSTKKYTSFELHALRHGVHPDTLKAILPEETYDRLSSLGESFWKGRDEPINTLTPIQLEIVREVYTAVEKLGGGMEILGAIGSWGDTLPESDILELLKQHNDKV